MSGGSRTHDERLSEILASRDVGCLGCGYNLRGLAPGGRCPECGTPVARSVSAPLLERVEGAWVRRAARGTWLMSLGLLVWVATGATLAVVAGALVATLWLGGFTGWSTPLRVLTTVGIGGGSGGLLLVVAGQILATGPERALDADLAFRLWRRGVRLTIGTLVGVVVIGGAGVGLLSTLGVPSRTLWLGTDLYVPGIALGSVVAVAVFVGYLRELMAHVPDAGLGRRCAMRVRMLVGFVIVTLLGFQLSNTFLVALGRAAQGVGWAAFAFGLLGIGLATAWLALGLGACGRRFRACEGARAAGSSAAGVSVDPAPGAA